MKRKQFLFGAILLASHTLANASSVIQNKTYSDLYLKNCSLKNSINICYPERENNPSEQISFAQNHNLDIDSKDFCELSNPYDPEGFSICMETMKNPSESTFSSDDLDQSLITCEADYQLYLQEVFKEDFAGLNIAFDSRTKDVEFIHKAIFPETIVGFSSDVILFPEHNNGAFCNEDNSLDIKKINQQVAKAKKMITDFYSYDSLKQAVKILDNPNGNLAIISMTCPAENAEVNAQVIGYHQLPPKPKAPPKREKVEDKKVKTQVISSKCVSKDAEALISFHESNSNKNKEVFARPTGSKTTIPYEAIILGNIRSSISSLCNELGDRIEITANGVYVDNKKVPTMSGGPYDMSTFDPNNLPRVARNFVSQLMLKQKEKEQK